jgi:hypothetical protein
MSEQPTPANDKNLDVSPQVDTAAAAVITLLLASDYQGPWTRAEIERELSSPSRDVSDALADLQAAGLIHIHDELVFSTSAARRMDELDL